MESARPCYSIDSFSSAVCPVLPRSEEVVYALNASDAGVGDVSGLEFLQPLQTNVSAARDFLAIGGAAGLQQFKGSIKKRGGHDAIIGNILPISQSVGIYRSGNRLPASMDSLWNMQKDDEDAVSTLAANVHRIKKTEMALSNAAVATRARRAGHRTISAKTVSNVERAEHSVGIGKVVAIATALQVPTWQLFIEGVPESPLERAALSQLVHVFLQLKERGRAMLLADADLLLMRKEGLAPEALRGRTDREAMKSSPA